MKKAIRRLAAAMLAALTMFTATALAESFGVVTGTDTLNLRSQGSSSSQWLGSYSRGTWLRINGSQNNFYFVYGPDGKTGYMSKNYIQLVDTSSVTGYAQVAIVNNQNGGAFLNFRARPSYSSSVLGIFYNGVPLLVKSYTDGWYCVQINGQTGYVRQEYVNISTLPASSTVATIKTPNNTAMNLRSGPGMNYGVVRQFSGDRYVMVLAQGKSWWYVSIDGYTGFMSADFLRLGLQSAKDLAAQSGTTPAGQMYAVVANPRSTQSLNLRQYASTGSAVLHKLYNGNRLWVHEQGVEWCSITDQTTGISGYVMTDYITLYNAPTVPSRQVVHPNNTYVNLRSSANMNLNNVLIRVPSGSSVTILIPGSDWCKVRYGGYTGYMMSYFLK